MSIDNTAVLFVSVLLPYDPAPMQVGQRHNLYSHHFVEVGLKNAGNSKIVAASRKAVCIACGILSSPLADGDRAHRLQHIKSKHPDLLFLQDRNKVWHDDMKKKMQAVMRLRESNARTTATKSMSKNAGQVTSFFTDD